MTTYSREYLQGLKREADLKQYNDKVDEVVRTISKAILFSATKGSTELTLKTKIIPPPKQLNWGPDTVVLYDIQMIHQVVNKLKIQFFDSHIEYVESKDLSGIILDSAIRVNWDEKTFENIKSHTHKQVQVQVQVQDENVIKGLARRKNIIEQENKKIQVLEEQIALTKEIIKKLTELN